MASEFQQQDSLSQNGGESLSHLLIRGGPSPSLATAAHAGTVQVLPLEAVALAGRGSVAEDYRPLHFLQR